MNSGTTGIPPGASVDDMQFWYGCVDSSTPPRGICRRISNPHVRWMQLMELFERLHRFQRPAKRQTFSRRKGRHRRFFRRVQP